MTGRGEVPTRNSPMTLSIMQPPPGRGRSGDGKVDSPRAAFLGRFLDIRTDSDEMNCPALSWHLPDQAEGLQRDQADAAQH